MALNLQLDQDVLRQYLEAKDHPVVSILDKNGKRSEKVHAADCLLMLERGAFAFASRKKRIRWMQPTTLPVAWICCWRTARAAVLEPSVEWTTTRESDWVSQSSPKLAVA